MKISKAIILAFCTMSITMACKKSLYYPVENEMSAAEFRVSEVAFEALSTKTKFQFVDKGNSISATANIRIRKDSLIWFVLTPALGIEAARGIITRDSMILVDRMNKTYSVYTFKDLSDRFNLDLNYAFLEAVILGNTTSKVDKENKVKKEGDYFRLLQTNGSINIDNQINKMTQKIEKVNVRDDKSGNSMTIVYTDFQPLADMFFANQTMITVYYKSKESGEVMTTQVNLEHSKADIESKKIKFPFNIPAKYELK